MRRALICCAALALMGGCGKKTEDTKNPDPTGGASDTGDTGDAGGGGSGGETAQEVPQEPDPPAIAEARAQVLVTDFAAAKATLEPLVADLTARSQYRASGLAASWLALAVVNQIAEDARAPAEYAMKMADKTGDKEVVIAANLASGAYDAGLERFPEAIAKFETAFNTDRSGTSAPLALILFGETKIGMAFDADDNLANPQELDSAGTSFLKARDLAATQPENAVLVGRAAIGMAAVARYKGDNKKACDLLKEANTAYANAGAKEYLTSGADALKDAARCK
ncbi:MAG: hypothetical protein R3B09_22125 [Nannocystaceae bacterium]